MSDKIYVGNGKEITFKDGGSIIKISISPDDLAKLSAAVSPSGWVNLELHKRKEVSAKGQTHYLCVDNWKPSPDSKQETGRAQNVQNVNSGLDDNQDIPF